MKKRNKKVKYDKGSKSQEHSKGGRDFLGLMLGLHVGGCGQSRGVGAQGKPQHEERR